MRLLRRVSIKSFLTGIVVFLVVILAVVSVFGVMRTYGLYMETERVDLANELSDDILEAAGIEAKERAVTAMALAADTADRQVVASVSELRKKGDAPLHKAYEIAGMLSAKDPTNTELKAALAKAESAFKTLENARKTADADFISRDRGYLASEWIAVMGALIDANADLRLASFASNAAVDTNRNALRMNLEIKQAAWLVSEFAGRERAIFTGYIADRKSLDASARERLNAHRAVVELNLKQVLQLKSIANIEPKVLSSVGVMEEAFVNRFGRTRTAVYAASATGDYPMTAKEWVDKSTEAIDSVLGVTASVGSAVDDVIMADLDRAKFTMIASIAGLVLVVAIGVLSIFIIRSKVISPLVYLSETITGLENTNDLTVSVKVDSEDENGAVATAFNRMTVKFRDIIQDIHGSVLRLASSSEELSASATQIAGGTQEQSSKASQVSTAAQEMSVTLTEVAKNVSEAAGAAMVASDAAVKGGDKVAKTIESMNGIAATAKESSVIIASLGSRSNEIGNIVNVINDIADQTNLLALNAAIEAARAGDQGRGFAVVADEVRKLAEKTMKATKEIGDMIKAMQDETEKAIRSTANEVIVVKSGVQLASEAGESLREIVDKVSVVTSMMQQITTSTEEQSAATEQITGDIESVATVVSDTSTGATQVARTSEEIARLAMDLKIIVEMFKTGVASRDDASPRNLLVMNRDGRKHGLEKEKKLSIV